MTHARLIRSAGSISVAAAVLIIASQLVGFFAVDPDPANLSETVTTTTATLYNILKLLGFFVLLLALIGLYAHQSVQAGVLGLIGFLVGHPSGNLNRAAKDNTHYIQFDRPKLAVDAIRRVVDAARDGSRV